MSSVVFSTSAAHGRSFIFEDEVCSLLTEAAIKKALPAIRLSQSLKNQSIKIPPASVIPASRLAIRPAPEMVSSGIAQIDALAGGLPRGCLTELFGPASSGRTTLLLSALAAATRRGEFCALVDAGDALDPHSAAAAGIQLDRLLWVRCGESSGHAESNYAKPNYAARNYAEQSLEQLLRATDLLLESGGFGLIALDLADVPPLAARRIPMTTWFRFRRAVEHTPTILLAIERQSIAGSCSSLLIKLDTARNQHLWNSAEQMNDNFVLDPELAAKPRKNAAHGASRGLETKDEEAPKERKNIGENPQFFNLTHTQLLTEIKITAEILGSRMDRKPAHSAEITFASKTAWAG